MPPRKKAAKRPSEDLKPWDIGLRTNGARERKRFKLTRSVMNSNENFSESDIAALAATLNGGSKETWGVGDSKPVEGMRRKIWKEPVLNIRKRCSQAQKYKAIMESLNRKPIPVGTNSSDTIPLLRTSLEIREGIYSYLFLFETPISVKYGWEVAERNVYEAETFSLVFTCKLFATEVSKFIFQNNVVQAFLRIQDGAYIRSEEIHLIPKLQLSNLRNIVLTCFRQCWTISWYEKASEGLTKLAEYNPNLESLTFIAIPERVMRSTTALGIIESNPVTFADFLWSKGPFMAAVRKLAPKFFKVVLKKGSDKQFEISVDMTSFQSKPVDIGPLVNMSTCWKLNRRSWMVEQELRGLKKRFEYIFNNDEEALRRGVCALQIVAPKNWPQVERRKIEEVSATCMPDTQEQEELLDEDISSRSSPQSVQTQAGVEKSVVASERDNIQEPFDIDAPIYHKLGQASRSRIR